MENEQKATFFVADIPIFGDVILAPMARYSDVPYRMVCREHGSAMNYTEFASADALLAPPNPNWRRLDKRVGEAPVTFQIFGNNAQTLLAAAQKIEAWEPDIIDINMGCSVARVSEHGAGVGMMPRPQLVAETFNLLTKKLRVPVTGKIRLGWDDAQKNYLEIGKIMQDNGASLVAMHARTSEQKYQYSADWEAIAELKQALSIPVIGNGDVRTPQDIDAMLAQSGCDAVMIGRAAVGNPWLFERKSRDDLTFAEIATTIRLHLREMLAYYGNPEGLTLFDRHLRRYFSGLPLKQTLKQLRTAQSAEMFNQLLDQAVQENGHLVPEKVVIGRKI